ncbi:SusC/RagA family TonB-linked outer membrane protein [Rhabdobacter roseus]|uniref:TonB-linked SusC/RagA family outer membrane protein n=1 Tax=Rhabdobacter roseus TaxID=1655419 RepID=A0A840TUU0_9BACT|nr:SusC/RagA family TonB-linked outer membrane protein [Rhabdobacter roseus]MBB5283828.1 TonB-linked SusC/RagA family outer membrane protein [Rhabdobacter roseus]
MKKFLSSVLMAVLLSSTLALAQERTVTGRVTAEDGSVLPGVNIALKGTTRGTSTSGEGTYSLQVPTGGTLVFSFIGFVSQEIAVGNQTEINVTLANDINQLQEVVVTALGIRREEKSIGYAAQTIQGTELSEVRETNVANSLTGKLAGVQVGTNSGAMGGSVKVTVRGVSSITGNNNALFVVDGMPFDNSNTNTTNQQRGGGGYDYGNTIQDLNPNDIETVTVLKGAAATALWGSRGANGVIMITTKRGSSRKGVGVNYTLGATMERVSVLPKFQNRYGGGYDFTRLYYDENPEAFPDGRQGYYTDDDGRSYDLIPDYGTDESWGPELLGQMYRPYWSWDRERGNPEFGTLSAWSPQPNNVRNFFETGTTLTNSISFDGGNDNGTFRFSYSNLDQKFILPNSSYKRHNFGFNGTYNLSEKLSVSTNANYVSNQAVGRPGTGYSGLNVTQAFYQWGQRQWDMDKMKDYQLPDGTQLTWNRNSWDDPTPKYTDNPYWTRYKNYQNDSRDRMYGNVMTAYKFNEHWSADVKFMTDFYSERQEERTAIGSQDIPGYALYKLNHNENNFQGLIHYDNYFSDNFSLNAYVGGNIMRRIRSTSGGATVDGLSSDVYNLNASIARPTVYDAKSEKQINSVFANASLGFANQLYLDLTARNDWSSTLPAGNNSYFYPSASLSWVFTESLVNVSWLSFGKLRAALASVGNDTDPYNTLLSYELRQPFGSDSRVSVPNSLPNQNLMPEITNEFEIGTELRFFGNRLGLNASYYNRQTKNQIIALSQSATTGYTNRFTNAGLVENKGVELSLNATAIQANNFSWNINVNWARNRNKVVKLTDEQKIYVLVNAPFAVQLQAREGESYGSIVGYNFVYDDNGNKIVDADGAYLRSNEQEVIGSVLPDFVGGVTNTFRYKNLSLSALIDFQKGGSFFSTTQMFGRMSGILEETAANNVREDGMIAPGVTAEGAPNTVALDPIEYYYSNGGYVINAADVVDASYIYLREVRIGYALPAKWFGGKIIQNANLAISGRNLLLLKSNSKHIDPSNITSSITNIQGIEGSALPSVRSVGFTLSFGL